MDNSVRVITVIDKKTNKPIQMLFVAVDEKGQNTLNGILTELIDSIPSNEVDKRLSVREEKNENI